MNRETRDRKGIRCELETGNGTLLLVDEMPGFVQREGECEYASAPRNAFGPNSTAVIFNDMPRNSQAKPGTFRVIGQDVAGASELIKYQLQVFGRNANAGI